MQNQAGSAGLSSCSKGAFPSRCHRVLAHWCRVISSQYQTPVVVIWWSVNQTEVRVKLYFSVCFICASWVSFSAEDERLGLVGHRLVARHAEVLPAVVAWRLNVVSAKKILVKVFATWGRSLSRRCHLYKLQYRPQTLMSLQRLNH